jgi:hypothetical protein
MQVSTKKRRQERKENEDFSAGLGIIFCSPPRKLLPYASLHDGKQPRSQTKPFVGFLLNAIPTNRIDRIAWMWQPLACCIYIVIAQISGNDIMKAVLVPTAWHGMPCQPAFLHRPKAASAGQIPGRKAIHIPLLTCKPDFRVLRRVCRPNTFEAQWPQLGQGVFIPSFAT